MSMVPDITAGTGTESDETPVGGPCGAVAVGRNTRDGRFRRWGSFPGAQPSGNWPTLDLHYVREEVRSKSSSKPHPGHFPTRRFHRPLSFRHARHNLWGCSARNFRVASPSPWLSPRFVRCVRMRWPKARKNRAYLTGRPLLSPILYAVIAASKSTTNKNAY